MAEPAPGVGRIVHYNSHGTPVREDGTQAYASRCRAAVITEVGGHPSLLALCVLDPTGQFFHPEVEQDDRDPLSTSDLCDGRPHLGGSWHWPARV